MWNWDFLVTLYFLFKLHLISVYNFVVSPCFCVGMYCLVSFREWTGLYNIHLGLRVLKTLNSRLSTFENWFSGSPCGTGRQIKDLTARVCDLAENQDVLKSRHLSFVFSKTLRQCVHLCISQSTHWFYVKLGFFSYFIFFI